MRYQALATRSLKWLAVCAALLASGFALPSSAIAACGRHRVVSSHLTDESFHFDQLTLVDSTSRSTEEAPRAPKDDRKPCTGALCSGQPGIPALPVTTVSDDAENWASLVPPRSPDDPASKSRWHDEAVLLPSHCGPSVFHPPRP